MQNKTIITCLLCCLLALLSAGSVLAKNVDLVTLPSRDTVQLTIYNSADLTLAKETRHITLKKGNNRLQFSWAGTLIDPTSVEFRPLAHADQIDVADTVFPGQKPQHLIWNIESEFEGQVPVEVSYFTSGLTWQMDYVATVNPAETELSMRGFVRVFNNSGEEYENANIRLIVGKINLVEKIADLARRAGKDVHRLNKSERNRYELDALRDSVSRADGKMQAGAGPGKSAKKIVKEGISEYFMFAIEGSESISNGWSKRMRAVKADKVRFDIVYRIRAYQYGPQPARFFIWKNDVEHKLGDSPLPNGTVRLFRKNGQDGLSYLGQQILHYVPIAAPIEVNLGPDNLVVSNQKRLGTSRLNFQFDRFNRHVTGWDEIQQWSYQVRNYRDKPISVEMRLQWNGDVDVTAGGVTKSFDYRTIETTFQVAARSNHDFPLTATIHHGTNARQARVALRRAAAGNK